MKKNSGRIELVILFILLFLFGASVIYMRTKEDPQKIYKKNSNMRIEVLNGCGVNRLAIKVTEILREKGFNVVKIGDLKDKVFTETVVIEREREDNANARYFAKRIHCKNIGSDIDPALYLDVTLIIGADYKKLFPDVEKKF
uniref:LytR family transcriptional regulator n=1 Tax=candidate division WOR-3 bacterium TaxID=2052148 RepID=A0A7C4XAW4_UNCW3